MEIFCGGAFDFFSTIGQKQANSAPIELAVEDADPNLPGESIGSLKCLGGQAISLAEKLSTERRSLCPPKSAEH